ncbi:MAG: transcription-repair coupling factor [Phototrophicales bacterium]|nr:MAG: transcription-repair coupling factor [Phototrophicales bacterium]
MHLHGVLKALHAQASFSSLVYRLQQATTSTELSVLRAARPYVIAALYEVLQKPILVVCDRTDRAHDIAEQLPVWLPDATILRFQEPNTLFYDHVPWTESVIRSRLQTLAALARPTHQQPLIVVTTAHALMQKTLPAQEFIDASWALELGSRVNIEKFLQHLVGIGYQPTSVVTTPGTFSRRGGILDVFPLSLELPVRIDFFDDEIDSLRLFDPTTQRSIESVQSVVITPAREAFPKKMPDLAATLHDWFMTQPSVKEDVDSLIDDLTQLSSGFSFPHAEFYLPLMYSNAASILDYMPRDALVIVDNWEALQHMVSELESQALELRQDRANRNLMPQNMPLAYHTWDDLYDELITRNPLHLGGQSGAYSTLGFAPDMRFGGQLRTFMDYIQQGESDEYMLIVTRQAQRLTDLWCEHVSQRLYPYEKIEELTNLLPVMFIEGELAEGWQLETENYTLHLLTDAEIFGWQRPEPRRRIQKRVISPESYFADLSEGDVVVHIDYGIGIFKGVSKRRIQNTEREYLIIEYAGGDVLHVPIHQVDRVSKYVGSEGKPPTISRLGQQDWQRTKQRTQAAVQEVAEELLALYAARTVAQGFAFSPDGPWQHELEASFPYIETEDQIKALHEVKADMERPIPMDRLICGDVGYGKTEIALRAAFKAVMDGKQVAILVPTTVLAQQHFHNFSQRLIAFPIEVEMLSRFRTKAEQQKIIEGLRSGQIDIVIGTHRLLQTDVQFHDLGLLIIDEEQRFGVTHKERLKRMRTEVDVLTLTATPIPRTLYMGLTGLRDISLIQTAPEERLPVINHVGPMDDALVRQAILREIDRGGQVFVVHNRVQSIYAMQRHLQMLVPEATFAVGHGQMDEQELEQVMLAFANGEYDVLLCTTIIENGIDIPRANTIIIDRADRFGLSQLYQLRGRVGRSANQGYAYFFYPRNRPLTSEARARLETIAEYTDLGVGMSIAIRDLELRGMGDLLGVRQSGYIDAVGFHLYTQMLTNAVREVSPQKPSKQAMDEGGNLLVTIDLPTPAYIPTNFVEDMALRIQLYRRIANINTLDELSLMAQELRDRFGDLPPAVEGLLLQIEVKLLAEKAGATAIFKENERLAIRLPYLGMIDRTALQDYLGEQVRVSRTAIWLLHDLKDNGWVELLRQVLRQLDRERLSPMANFAQAMTNN